MNSKFRGVIILICCIVILFCSFAFPWFVIKYQPVGGYTPRYFYFSFFDLIGHYRDVDALKFVYIQLGWVLLLALTSILQIPFLQSFIANQIKSIGDIVTFALTFFNTIHDKAIITQLDAQALKNNFGISDTAYIVHNSSTQILMGYIIMIIATALLTLVLLIPSGSMSADEATIIPGRTFAIVLAVCSVVVCCVFSTIAALTGQTTTDFEFFDNSHFVKVDSTLGWQDAHLTIKKGDIVYLLYIPDAGKWTAQKQNAASYTDARGNPAKLAANTATSKYPLNGLPIQALIGKIGNAAAFLVGNGDSFVATDDGNLSLRMNQRDGSLATDAGTIEEQITVVRYASGVHISTTKVTLDAAAGWQDTNVVADGGHELFSIAYVYGSGTMPQSNALVSPDTSNGIPPDFTFIEQGFSPIFPYTYTGQGLSAKIGKEQPFTCGFGILARPKPDADSSAEGDHLYLSIQNRGTIQGTIQVLITHVTYDTVSTYTYI